MNFYYAIYFFLMFSFIVNESIVYTTVRNKIKSQINIVLA